MEELQIQYLLAGSVSSPAGFLAAAGHAGLRKTSQPDVALVVSHTPCSAAGMFTTNQVVAAPVTVCRETLASHANHIYGVVANAKNANACTGEPGLTNARLMQQLAAQAAADQLNMPELTAEHFLVLSTGVIGQQMPMDKIATGIAAASQKLSSEGGLDAAKAIMTTDTFAKHLAVQVQLQDGLVTIGGMAKGAGMIHPNMATMLALLTTDAQISAPLLQGLLHHAVTQSFNCVSVDGDTSTNDTILILANGQSGVGLGSAADVETFQTALNGLTLTLAKMIVQDGEGATKLVEVCVQGAPDVVAAKQVANTIATSPLFKTALAGHDPNWGRILAAAGRAGVPFAQAQAALWVQATADSPRLQLLTAGTPTNYLESEAAAIFALPEFTIILDLGAGNGSARVYTCDLTADYVRINADYRT